ncbi:hypothetical protein KSI86_01975 [Dickeya oryzae]|uniref:hypothetical protein n=1 Tax=Dickeya oryzae TaxID=1240404 RepID=UPI002097D8B4|nr:hypothetical protein [Dickeya oryzae]MCO7252923.1 hypothetical protein [Dickeya oryzae]
MTLLRILSGQCVTPPARHDYREKATNNAQTGAGANGEQMLAGDWFTQSRSLTLPFSIEALPGRIMIRAESGAMLA